MTNTTTQSRKTLQSTLKSIGLNCDEEEIFSAGFSGVQAIKAMGYPTCSYYITDDLKKDYLIFEEDIEKPEVIIVGDYEDWDFKKLNQAFQYVMSGS